MIHNKPKKIDLQKYRGNWIIFFSFVVSLMLAIMPLPIWAAAWRPDWVAITLIYWCITVPQRVGMITASLTGLVLDGLKNTLLGQHALVLCLVAFVSIKIHLRMRTFPPWQQAMIVFAFVASSQLLNVWIQSILGYPTIGMAFLYSAITSFFLWPWVSIILRDFLVESTKYQ